VRLRKIKIRTLRKNSEECAARKIDLTQTICHPPRGITKKNLSYTAPPKPIKIIGAPIEESPLFEEVMKK